MHVKLDKKLVLDLFVVSVINQKLITKECFFLIPGMWFVVPSSAWLPVEDNVDPDVGDNLSLNLISPASHS